MSYADVLVFATPIYYYEMCGQMKTLLDRANPLYASDYAFRNVYFVGELLQRTATRSGARAASGLEGWIACFPKSHFSGVIFGGGVTVAGTIQGNPAMQKVLRCREGDSMNKLGFGFLRLPQDGEDIDYPLLNADG